jgi:hypothetical protein
LAIGLGALLLVAHASADEWSMEPAIGVSAEFSENPLFQLASQDQAYGAVTDLSATFAWRTPNTTLTALPDLRVARYPSFATLDGTDMSLDLALTQLLENGQLDASASAVRDHTIATELDTTGFAETNRRRDIQRFSIGGQWRATERMMLGTRLSYEATDFIRDPLVFLVDYRYPSVLAYVQRALDERTQIALTASAGGVRGGQFVAESNNYALQVSLDRKWNERWASNFSIGPSVVTPKDGASLRGTIFLADLTHSSERSLWHFSALRELRATGRGVLEGREELSTSFNRSLTETWSANLALRLVRTQESYRGLVGDDLIRTYGRAETGLSWHWNPQWNLHMSYVYSQQHYASLNNDPIGHQVSIGIGWNGWRLATSR